MLFLNAFDAELSEVSRDAKKSHVSLLVWLQFGKNCKFGGHFAVSGATQPSLELYGQELVILVAVPMAVNSPNIVRFGSPSGERGAVKVGRQVDQILANFGKNTLTSEGCCGAPSGPILLRFAVKFLESVVVSGNQGQISFL